MISVLSSGRGEPLTVGISIFTPIHPALGSPILLFTQGLISRNVAGSSIIISGLAFLMAIINKLFKLEQKSPPIPENTKVIKISLKELQDFLSYFKIDRQANPVYNENLSAVYGERDIGNLKNTADNSIVFSLAIICQYSDKFHSPSIFINLPIFSLPGARGTLPLLILETLATIFVRAVVPPYPNDDKPENSPKTFELTGDELIHIIQRFGRHFMPDE